MSHLVRFSCPLPNGLHARPATHLAEAAVRFSAAVAFHNERSGRSANARSVLALVATDTKLGDPCRLEIVGPDADAAALALEAFVTQELANCDEPLAIEPAVAGRIALPRSLAAAGLTRYVAGQPACRGVGIGTAMMIGTTSIPADASTPARNSPAAEQAAFDAAVQALGVELQAEIAVANGPVAGVLRAHLAVLRDPGLGDTVAADIRRGATAGEALSAAVTEHRAALASATSAYIQERVLDLEDVAGRLWRKLSGEVVPDPALVLTEPSVVMAERLTPSQFLSLDRTRLQALVLAHAGQTSHAVILARSFGIPTVTAVAEFAALTRATGRVIVDATLGLVITDATEGVCRYYDREREKLRRIAAQAALVRGFPARTADGQALEIGANIASVEEGVAAFAQGADGIGLFRTELLFANRTTAPSEDEQTDCYAAVVRAAGGRPVIIRTLDVGGDKPVPFLKFPTESNPFLGYRGIRFYADQAPLIRTQLRAILRAAADGPVKILVPMLASVEEGRLVRRLLTEAEGELRTAGRPVPANVPLGFMLEVPSTAFLLDELCAEADFFSLGTNDLAQYFSAADRENPAVAGLNHPLQPAFLRLLKHLVDGVRARGRWIGLCGELGENPAALPLLVGLGLDEISLAAPRIAATKLALASLEHTRCRELLDQVLEAATREAAERVLSGTPARAWPMIATELVLDGIAPATKEETIRSIADALHLAGRTQDAAAVEAAIWQREDTYSTGFGDGFALPHAKTDTLVANTIVVARLARPVEWNALDGKPVDIVIFLGIRASESGKAHLETLARLSRLAMREEFREQVRRQIDAPCLVSLLNEATHSRASK